MRLYWYAPFNNASELALASQIARFPDLELVIQSCSHRFGTPLLDSPVDFELVRDLPPPAGEMGERRHPLRQFWVAVTRAYRRQRVVSKGRFDIVHLHTINPVTDWIALRIVGRSCSQLVLSVHDVRPQKRRMPSWLETAVLRLVYRRGDLLLVAHPYLKELLVRELGVDPSKVVIVPLPVLQMDGVPAPTRTVASAPIRLLFFGTFRLNKGMAELLDAMHLLSSDSRVSLLIAGRGEPKLEELVKQSAATCQAITAEVGYVSSSRRSELLAGAHLIVLPYTEFNSQSGVLSGDAYGSTRPVIASDIGALGESVRTDGSGWTVEPGDAVDLAQKIQYVANNPAEFGHAVQGIKQVKLSRSPEAIAQLIYKCYSSLNEPMR